MSWPATVCAKQTRTGRTGFPQSLSTLLAERVFPGTARLASALTGAFSDRSLGEGCPDFRRRLGSGPTRARTRPGPAPAQGG